MRGVQKRGLRGGCAAFVHARPGFATIASPTHDAWNVSVLPFGVKGASPQGGWASLRRLSLFRIVQRWYKSHSLLAHAYDVDVVELFAWEEYTKWTNLQK